MHAAAHRCTLVRSTRKSIQLFDRFNRSWTNCPSRVAVAGMPLDGRVCCWPSSPWCDRGADRPRRLRPGRRRRDGDDRRHGRDGRRRTPPTTRHDRWEGLQQGRRSSSRCSSCRSSSATGWPKCCACRTTAGSLPSPSARSPRRRSSSRTGEIKLGPDLSGGITLIYELAGPTQSRRQRAEAGDKRRPEATSRRRSGRRVDGRRPTSIAASDDTIAALIGVLSERIDPTGTKEVTIRKFGEGQIEIIIPKAEQAGTRVHRAADFHGRHCWCSASPRRRDFRKHQPTIEHCREAARRAGHRPHRTTNEVARWVELRRDGIRRRSRQAKAAAWSRACRARRRRRWS